MDEIKDIIKNLLGLMGFTDYSADFDIEKRKLIIFINESEGFDRRVPEMINDLMHLTKVMAIKRGCEAFFIDINNYRKERENIIIDLAKAAARKVMITKEAVRLPVMNSYERRIIHAELSLRTDIKTESEGVGDNRLVVVKPL